MYNCNLFFISALRKFSLWQSKICELHWKGIKQTYSDRLTAYKKEKKANKWERMNYEKIYMYCSIYKHTYIYVNIINLCITSPERDKKPQQLNSTQNKQWRNKSQRERWNATSSPEHTGGGNSDSWLLLTNTLTWDLHPPHHQPALWRAEGW